MVTFLAAMATLSGLAAEEDFGYIRSEFYFIFNL